MRTDEEVNKIIQDLGVNNQTPIDSEKYRKYKKAYKYAKDMLEKECLQSCEALYHNLNTLESRAGSQVPFTSINIGRDISTEGRLVTKSLLQASINGIGKFHLTSIFPISIFQLKTGVNKNPGDPNYDLKQLALKSMSKRIYPNWCNCDWSEAHEDENDIDTLFATMGALAEQEHLYIKINDGQPMDISIKDLFDMLNNKTDLIGRPCDIIYNKPVLDLPNDLDSRHHQSKKDFSIKSESGVYKITYIPEDVTYIGSSNNIKQRFNEHKASIKYQGKLDGGVCFGDNNIDNYKFEVVEYCEDYKDKEKHFIETVPNINIKGTSTKYFKNRGYKLTDNHTRPNIKMNPTVQQTLINLEDLDIKVFDIDNKWTKIKHIFKNDKMNTPLMMSIQYLEHNKTYTLCCTEDHPLWTGKQFTRADELQVGDYLYRADGLELPITNIQYYYERKDSYDIGTETGTFIGSDIMMHNCRTLIGYDRHGLGYKRVGRGNNVPNTIILPKIAIENGICLGKRTEPDLDGFWKDLDKALKICEQGLLERYNIIKKQSPKAASFMYENATMTELDLNAETVEESVKHNTLGFGLIGIAEMCQALFGKTHDEDEEVHKFALSVVEHIYNYAKEASERNDLNMSCYFTPAESLCHTALKELRQQYGIIKDVTSHEYLTNSCHVPVWHKISIYDKLKCEAPFTKYATAGCITYIELDSTFVKNTKAVEDIINYACELNIPYLAFNFPIDSCLDCGYQGEFNSNCPECGSKNIEQLRRVTGYLTTDYHKFNAGKQAETEERVKHSAYTKFE